MGELELYTDVGDGIISCNACGAYTLDGNREHIKHYPSCGGLVEVKKWDDYYRDWNEEDN